MSEVIKLNDKEYKFECTFFNGTPNDNSLFFVPISYGAIRYIEITDTMFNPFLLCNFAIDNPLNFIEKQQGNNTFSFKSNNRNMCGISLAPVELETSTDVSIKQRSFMQIFGVIDNGESVASDSTDASMMLFDVIDSKQAALAEKKVGHVYPKIDRTIPVSENIKRMLQTIHPSNQDTIIDNANFKGNDQGLTIDTEYVFPLKDSLLDAIRFLLPYNVGVVNGLESQMFLKFDYTTNKYINYSVYDLFNNAQSPNVTQETFILGGKEGSTTQQQTNTSKFNAVTKTLKDNIIHNVGFSNVNFHASNKDLVPVYYTSTTSPTNITELNYINLQEAIDNFTNNVLKTAAMQQIYGNIIELNVDMDESKQNQQNYKLINKPFSEEVNRKLAAAQLYNSFIFQNMTLNFSVPGQSYRQSGMFINIARSTDAQGVKFDDKLLGQWLVVGVTHIIRGGVYTNYLQCVKPFRLK